MEVGIQIKHFSIHILSNIGQINRKGDLVITQVNHLLSYYTGKSSGKYVFWPNYSDTQLSCQMTQTNSAIIQVDNKIVLVIC
jgi:hypothetical protein